MNGIIITGAPRAGKSTCVEKLLREEKGYSVINGDAITVSLFYQYNGKKEFNLGRKKTYDIFEKTIMEYPKLNIILDYHYIEPEKLLEYYKKGYRIIFFGYPNVQESSLKKRIRQKEELNDWTNQMDDDELNKMVKKGITISKRDYLFCKETGISFVDTSYGLEKAYLCFVKELKKSV